MPDQLSRTLHAIDRFQQRHRALALPLAVLRKFNDDRAGSLAALIAYYGFLSVFPLLLALVTALGLALRGDAALQHRVLNSALTEFPVIGPQLRDNIHSLGRNGTGLVVGLVLALLGGRGVANALQNAMNSVWEVPRYDRPGFPKSLLRSLGLLLVIGVGVIVTTTLSSFGSGVAHGTTGLALRGLLLAVSLAVNFGLFWLGLRVATAPCVPTGSLRVSAALSALVWQVLQVLGTYLVAHSLKHASSLYGVFGIVLGLIAWLHLQAQITLYAVEFDLVRTHKLWPRSLFPPPLTDEDREAYASYQRAEQRIRRPHLEVAWPAKVKAAVSAPASPAAGPAAEPAAVPSADPAGKQTANPAAEPDPVPTRGTNGKAPRDAGTARPPGEKHRCDRPGGPDELRRAPSRAHRNPGVDHSRGQDHIQRSAPPPRTGGGRGRASRR